MWLKSAVLLCRRKHLEHSVRACRHIYLESKSWPVDIDNDGYTDDLRQEVEKYWSPRIQVYLQKYHSLQQTVNSDASAQGLFGLIFGIGFQFIRIINC